MRDVLYLWQSPEAIRKFQTGVCLHGHTMHSEECLSFLPRYLHHVPGLSQLVTYHERASVDFARAYWTPPLAPAAAFRLEWEQIARLGMQPLVSLTDHDNIEAGLALKITAVRREAPVSVEWTVPYRGAVLHLGIHNLPHGEERSWMAAMAEYTSSPHETRLPAILSELAKIPTALVVLNHPFWLEEGVTQAVHDRALPQFLRECVAWIHGFEINGTRVWTENADTLLLARAHSRPVISGGDRHACEPGACINLTNARSFEEFVSEVKDGESTVVVMPQYREPMALRIFEASWDILRPYPEYPDRQRWIDRFYYRGDDGAARPLSVVWKERAPWSLNRATSLLEFIASARLRPALRTLLASRGPVLP